MTTSSARKVHAISSGSYSDYSIICIVDGTEEEAEALASRMNAGAHRSPYSDSYFVEELPIASPDARRVEMFTLAVKLDAAGQPLWEPPLRTDVHWSWDDTPDVKWTWKTHLATPGGGYLVVEGTDLERVRKVYSDRRAMYASDDAMRAEPAAEGGR